MYILDVPSSSLMLIRTIAYCCKREKKLQKKDKNGRLKKWEGENPGKERFHGNKKNKRARRVGKRGK